MSVTGVPISSFGVEDTSLAAIQSKIAFMLDRDDMDSAIINTINTVIRRIERKHNFKYMKYRDSVVLAQSTYETLIPSRYKEMISLKYDDNGDQLRITHKSEEDAMSYYPNLTTDTGEPVYYSSTEDAGNFLIRPTASANFTLYRKYYRFSSAVTGPTEHHWLFDNFQEVILYGVCLEFAPILKDISLTPVWAAALKDALLSLKKQEDHEESADTDSFVRGSYASH